MQETVLVTETRPPSGSFGTVVNVSGQNYAVMVVPVTLGPEGPSGSPNGDSDSTFIIGFNGAGGPQSGGNPDFARFVQEHGGLVHQGNFLNLNNESQAAAVGTAVATLMGMNQGELLIVVLGYSRGGNTGVQFANYLGSRGISVRALITFDPHVLFGDLSLDHGNVESALNFYQRNPADRDFGIPAWATNPYQGAPVTGATNVLLGPSITHLNIVDLMTGPGTPTRRDIDERIGN